MYQTLRIRAEEIRVEDYYQGLRVTDAVQRSTTVLICLTSGAEVEVSRATKIEVQRTSNAPELETLLIKASELQYGDAFMGGSVVSAVFVRGSGIRVETDRGERLFQNETTLYIRRPKVKPPTALFYVVISPNGDVEILDGKPRWNWAEMGQTVRAGYVNGGDTCLITYGAEGDVEAAGIAGAL